MRPWPPPRVPAAACAVSLGRGAALGERLVVFLLFHPQNRGEPLEEPSGREQKPPRADTPATPLSLAWGN